ncbi:TPA: hypothetical protein DCP77_03550 [Candidatus Collierbacteria bacterium]|uniref:DUF5666 domain-containing protein n=1 Tax=Candidatus Collierbacteria bacterium GW2011_GWA2_42_17 TaxID=1618378 RepID=A0A0G0Z351_9BACT|nr:MAG: hypothetical protein UU94_C0004G0082 [Candidatus Collierbacteria bacterium GW2011_GWB2_42_12]KKS43145.1 MAG: hypothetical protein UV06_C0002G0047 [Candidatus Collierbacteria bacterium GW2011_GWA2_42_17]KKS62164.1 MAG: hypothetical protein UV28_C0016G0009 [Candidatus Collierbacteria bacterium GW2011_GWE2_42_48]KKS62347.1 MAG: hypothetical protein UV29_C0017G0009 [Candidatus Collierbacteria bacterium GW2011_GWD2_42_50]KKS62803.1 MAG: hypothetical protein UV30_C0010G0006 [Candidatus Collie
MKKLFLSLTTIFLSLVFVQPVMAITATPSATPTPDIEEKYKLIVQENVSSIAAKLQEKVNLMSLVGYVGKITTISSGNLTVDSHGVLLQVTSTAKTVYLKNNSTIKVTSLAIDDKVIIIGTSIKDGIIQAKRVSVIKDEPILVKTTAVIAKVVSVDIKKKTLTLTINGADQVLTLSKKSTVKLDQFSAGQTILGIVKEYDGNLSISRAKTL